MTPERLAELERLLQLGAWLSAEQSAELVAEVRRLWAKSEEVTVYGYPVVQAEGRLWGPLK